MPTDAEHLAAREAIDQFMSRIRQQTEETGGYRIRIADAVDALANAREWAVVEDEGDQVEDLTLLYHSTNPAEVAAYLCGWLRGEAVQHETDE